MDNEKIYNEIGKLIKKERKKKGITQEKLAMLTSYSLSFIANIESNTYQSFSIHTLYNIANALNVSVHNLIPDRKNLINYSFKCPICNYNVSIPKEIGKIAYEIQEICSKSITLTCPNCQKKKIELNF